LLVSPCDENLPFQDGIIRSLGEKLGLAETATEVISMKAGKLGSWEAASLGIP
jgi:hypothetical protein